MTTYTTITNPLVAVGAKPFATTVQALRDNPIAMFEGSTGAPRLALEALERTTVGDVVKVRRDAGVTTLTADGEQTVLEFGFMQVADVRVTLDHRHSDGTAYSTVRVKRWRGGAVTTLQTWTEAAGVLTSRTLDITGTFRPGDSIRITNEASGAGDSSTISSIRIKTAGENLWPGDINSYMEPDFSA